MKNIYTWSFLFLLMILFQSCRQDPKNEKTTTVDITSITADEGNLNISFLLDLSDRIDPVKHPMPSMEFYKRDSEYIKSVVEAFDIHLRAKKVRKMDDKIQLFFDPEPLNQEINTISSALKFHVNKDSASKSLLRGIVKAYTTQPEHIYKLAIKDDKYVGSNTWKFFKNKAKQYCVEARHRNILVILTDGYIYHENAKQKEKNLTTYLTPQDIRRSGLTTKNWKQTLEKKGFGFIPIVEDLSTLEILVLGINPDKKNPYEEDVIKAYWKNWFKAMNVKRFQLLNADLPSDMDRVIRDFILDR